MQDDKKLIAVYKEAWKFLEEKVGKKVLLEQLDYYEKCEFKTMNVIFKRMLESLKNKQGYVNFIGDVGKMKKILLNFSPSKTYAEYGNDWKRLFEEFKKEFGGHYKMDINNKRNAWVIYSKGTLSCAKFLGNFKSTKDFDTFVKQFSLNEFTIAALPMLLEKEIFGFGFPLACDFIKELGYLEYGKPDIHLKDIFEGVGIVEDGSDYEVFKKIVKIGLLTETKPIVVDKVFWLIGSGNFYQSNIKIPRQKQNFINYFNKCYLSPTT